MGFLWITYSTPAKPEMAAPEPSPAISEGMPMTTETKSDYDTIDHRRKLRRIIAGHAYDTETASLLHRIEHISSDGYYFSGEALYINVYNKLFLHHYHQWDRFNGIIPYSTAQAIAWLEKHCPTMIEGFFGKLPEAGQGEPYTPIEDTTR